MKKVLLMFAVCLLFAVNGYSQFSFGVAPGLSTNTAYFGFKAGKVVPYVGFQFANANFKMESSGAEWDGTDVVETETDMKISANIYAPTIGIKFFAVEKNNLKAYFNLSVAKPIVRGKMQSDGDDVEIPYHGDDVVLNDILKEIKFIGGEFGFGVEYFFDDNFSLGGEFGIRYFSGKYDTSWEEEVWNGTDAQDEDFSQKIKVGIMPTYSKIALNFYFGGNGAE